MRLSFHRKPKTHPTLLEVLPRHLDIRIVRKTLWRCTCRMNLAPRKLVALAVSMHPIMWVHRLFTAAKIIFILKVWPDVINCLAIYAFEGPHIHPHFKSAVVNFHPLVLVISVEDAVVAVEVCSNVNYVSKVIWFEWLKTCWFSFIVAVFFFQYISSYLNCYSPVRWTQYWKILFWV